MASKIPLTGTDLVDCARANSNQGIQVAANLCGYGDDIAEFQRSLQKAGEYMGVEIQNFNDLAPNSQGTQEPGIVIAPDSPSDL